MLSFRLEHLNLAQEVVIQHPSTVATCMCLEARMIARRSSMICGSSIFRTKSGSRLHQRVRFHLNAVVTRLISTMTILLSLEVSGMLQRSSTTCTFTLLAGTFGSLSNRRLTLLRSAGVPCEAKLLLLEQGQMALASPITLETHQLQALCEMIPQPACSDQ